LRCTHLNTASVQHHATLPLPLLSAVASRRVVPAGQAQIEVVQQTCG
jgi:hypothetical protein